MFTQLSFSFSVTGSMIQIALEKIIKAVTRFLKYCLKSNNTQNVSHSLSPLTTEKFFFPVWLHAFLFYNHIRELSHCFGLKGMAEKPLHVNKKTMETFQEFS